MRILSLLVAGLLIAYYYSPGDSPHGKDFKVSCSLCHSSKGWFLDTAIYAFDHNTTRFALNGQHAHTTCRGCHQSLVFSEARRECNECHTDIHQSTTGLECGRCHNTFSWLVQNITEIHQASRFPLLGAHRMADCIDCHKSETMVRFDVPGVECVDCHREDFNSTTNPNHIQAGFSEDCSFCHPVNSFSWTGAGFNHNFFPLVQGHSGVTCATCHTSGNYGDASPACYSCHSGDYQSATNPNHTDAHFPTTCETCHTLNPGWKPANFDHNIFPLTKGHAGVACAECHLNGNYTSTPTECYGCHQTDYSGTTNPGHSALSFSTTCTECHTTDPGWKPAKYTQHDQQFFPIYSGRHKGTWDLCSECHTDPANYTAFDCKRCHTDAHRGENYTNQQCYSCHPTGNED